MSIFAPLYRKVMAWSRHPQAERYLAGVSFVESWFFPVPTALLLAPMVLANRVRAWRLAWLATITSVLGGLFGYLIGYFFFEQLGEPIIEFYHAEEQFDSIKQWFGQYGVWIVLLAGVTPFPYKVVTIASGLLGLPIVSFAVASLIGRASQFFLVAGVLWWGGDAIKFALEKWMEVVGWGLIVVIALVYLLIKFA